MIPEFDHGSRKLFDHASLLHFDFALSFFFRREVPYDSDEHPSSSRDSFTNAYENRKFFAVFVSAALFSANAYDFLDTGFFVIFDVLVVLAMVRLGHDDVDVLPDRLVCCVAEH